MSILNEKLWWWNQLQDARRALCNANDPTTDAFLSQYAKWCYANYLALETLYKLEDSKHA